MSNGVWLLTRSHNAYDQYGDYPCCIWEKRPTIEDLKDYFKTTSEEFLAHVSKGGGRQAYEEVWYHLDFVKFGAKIDDY